MNNFGNTIKQLITMEDVLCHYGFPTSINGRIPCPLHNGKDNNFSYKDHYFKCFVCGRGGSVIDFVMELFGINYQQAVLRINQDFSLGLTNQRTSRSILSEAARRKRQERREEEKRKQEWWEAIRLLWYYREAVELAQPVRTIDSVWIHPIYADAVKALPEIEYWLDERFREGDDSRWNKSQSSARTTS